MSSENFKKSRTVIRHFWGGATPPAPALPGRGLPPVSITWGNARTRASTQRKAGIALARVGYVFVRSPVIL